MPIPRELRKFYGPAWRTEVRPRILARAGDKCENCDKPNGAEVYTRSEGGSMWWLPCPNGLVWRGPSCMPKNFEVLRLRRIRVQIHIAHLNHTPGDDRDDNLKALCQWCHFDYDLRHHHFTRATRKDSGRPILAALLKEAS